MREQLAYDPDGDVITFSPEDKIAIAEEITIIDTELAGQCGEAVLKQLTRQRRQLVAELAAGHYLPIWNVE